MDDDPPHTASRAITDPIRGPTAKVHREGFLGIRRAFGKNLIVLKPGNVRASVEHVPEMESEGCTGQHK